MTHNTPHVQAITEQGLQLYASNQFLREAAQGGVRSFDLQVSEVYEVVRMARGGDPIPNLGGVALLGQSELGTPDSKEVVAAGQSALAGKELQEQIMLNELKGNAVQGQSSLGQTVAGHAQQHRSFLYFGTEPDERKITEALYDAAGLAGSRNDEWFGSVVMDVGEIVLPGILGPRAQHLGAELARLGQHIPTMRRNYDRARLLPHKRPIILTR